MRLRQQHLHKLCLVVSISLNQVVVDLDLVQLLVLHHTILVAVVLHHMEINLLHQVEAVLLHQVEAVLLNQSSITLRSSIMLQLSTMFQPQ